VSSGVAVPYTKDEIKDAPNVDPSNGHVDEEQEAALYRHYGLAYPSPRSESGLPDSAPPHEGRRSAEGEEGLVRSEEELHVGTERVEAGRARLRKYVVTEEQSVTVPVRKEKVRLESEPLSEGDRASEIVEGETEVTLSEERPVVQKETVAKEKVGLVKEVEEEQRTVTEDVRKEQIEAEGDIDRR
jgi:uncharacterized protein (TIGR02271 family)